MDEIKIAWVIGIGGVGGYFGGQLALSLSRLNDERKVYFAARGRHLQEIKATG